MAISTGGSAILCGKNTAFPHLSFRRRKIFWSGKRRFFEEIADNAIQGRRRVYLMGVSVGASLAWWFSAHYPQIRRVLCVNPVLNLNLHLTIAGVCNFCGEKMTIVLGEKDPSAKWERAKPKKKNIDVRIQPGADHVFGGMLEEFIALPRQFLFESFF